MRAFLTGGTGFIGQSLAKALLARSWNIRAVVRRTNSPQARALTNLGVQVFAGDVTERESMRTAMQGVDIVVHNAGVYEFGLDRAGEQRMRDVNVAGTEHVLGLAHELGIPRTVYVSSVVAYGGTGTHKRDETCTRQTPCRMAYERSKTDAHEIALRQQRRGLPLIIVCPGPVIGPNDHSSWGYFLRLYINRLLLPLGWSPEAVHALVYRDDLAEGIALAAERGRIGEVYILSGEARTFREHVDYWTLRPGAYRPLFWLPAGIVALCFAPLEPLQRTLGLPAFISRETVRAASMSWHFSSQKAKRELGWMHRSAEAMWIATIDGELELLLRREDQNVIQRLKPLDTVD